MLLEEDVFRKDEISIEIATLAGNFIQTRRQLVAMKLSDTEREILESQLPLYPKVINNLEKVALLAIEENPDSTKTAKNIIVNEIVPRQEIIIDGFFALMAAIEIQVGRNVKDFQAEHRQHQRITLLLLLFIIAVSIITIFVVAKNILKIESRLTSLSNVDPLTGILNRRALNLKLQEAIDCTARTNANLAILLIDVDEFKKYNDTYGHQQGDQCLKTITEILREVAYRSIDIIARYGGEEFIMVLPSVDIDGAMTVAKRLQAHLAARKIPHSSSTVDTAITVSIGIAINRHEHSKSIDELVREADLALYESKASGRNRYSLFKE
ncbi:MAG: GGDEF domain-containing protein [bacterium]